MTRDELIEKVATALDKAERENSDFHHMADVAISTIFAELKDPTGEMVKWGCMEICADHEAEQIWQDMLNASPLSPNND